MPHSFFRTTPLSLTLAPSTTSFLIKLPHSSPPYNSVSFTAPPYTSSEMDAPVGTKTKIISTPPTACVKNIGMHNATCANFTDTFSGTVPNIAASIVAPIAERSPDNARTRRSPSLFSLPAYRRSPNAEAHPHATSPLLTTDYSQIIPSPSSTPLQQASMW